MWIVMYFIMYLSISYSASFLNKAWPYFIIGMLCLQVAEFSEYCNRKRIIYSSFTYSSYPADILYEYDLSAYKHIQFMQYYDWGDYYSDSYCHYQFVGYTRYALDNDMTVSNFHFARDYDIVVQQQIEKSCEELKKGKPDLETIYIFPKYLYDEGEYDSLDNVAILDNGYDIILIPLN